MSTGPHPPESAARWFVRGALCVFSIPALVLFSAQIGFTALAREAGFDAPQTMAIAFFTYAIPAQVVFVGFVASGASLPAVALAVALSSVRFLPMVLAWTPIVRPRTGGRIATLAVAWFVAVTSWVFAMTKLPTMDRAVRLPYFSGFGIALSVVSTIVVGISYVLLDRLPPMLGGALVFLTPIYFLCALWGAARVPADRLALLFGLVAGPVAAWLVPGLDLLVAGLVAGTLAYVAGRLTGPRPAALAGQGAEPGE